MNTAICIPNPSGTAGTGREAPLPDDRADPDRVHWAGGERERKRESERARERERERENPGS